MNFASLTPFDFLLKWILRLVLSRARDLGSFSPASWCLDNIRMPKYTTNDRLEYAFRSINVLVTL